MKKSTKSNREEEFALMQKIASGDARAFEFFNEQYYKLIYSTVFKVLNNTVDTEEVCNDVLTTMWRKANGYHPSRGSLVTWICTTARNRAIDRVRSHQRRASLYDRYESNIGVESSTEQDSVGDHMARRDASHIVRSAVVTLSPEQREVIELAYFQGLTQTEIASQINKPLGTVKARIRRGVQEMRKVVTKDYGSDTTALLPQAR